MRRERTLEKIWADKKANRQIDRREKIRDIARKTG